jgi:DNA repair exonuclease SbcCD ATPase subunit
VHWLTKTLVLIVAVLGMLLSALTVAMSVNADRIVNDFEQERSLKIAAEATQADVTARAAQEQNRLNAQIEQFSRDLAAREAEIRNLSTERASLLADKNKAELERDTIASKIKELGATTQTQAELLKNYSDEVTGLRKNELTFRQRQVEMDDRVSDLESQREVLEQTVRALQEQLADAQLAVQKNLSGGGAVVATAASTGDSFVLGGQIVRGKIEKVEKDNATGATLVQINLGTADNIKENTKLFVGRSDGFVANLIVIKSDLKWAVGKIDTLGRDVKVQEGDWVVSRLQ